jgi:hypothetical protein
VSSYFFDEDCDSEFILLKSQDFFREALKDTYLSTTQALIIVSFIDAIISKAEHVGSADSNLMTALANIALIVITTPYPPQYIISEMTERDASYSCPLLRYFKGTVTRQNSSPIFFPIDKQKEEQILGYARESGGAWMLFLSENTLKELALEDPIQFLNELAKLNTETIGYYDERLDEVDKNKALLDFLGWSKE